MMPYKPNGVKNNWSYIITKNKHKYFRYQIKNKLIHKEITRKDILEIKKAVEDVKLLLALLTFNKPKNIRKNIIYYVTRKIWYASTIIYMQHSYECYNYETSINIQERL